MADDHWEIDLPMHDATRNHRSAALVARFLSKIDQDGPIPDCLPDRGPCWLWRTPGKSGGYCYFYLDGSMRLAHRVSYELFTGPIPSGLHIDHLCSVRNCVNPAHLEAVTQQENNRRGRVWLGGSEFQRAKTHCPQGHPYAGDNLRITPEGHRACRACARETMARRRAALPAKSRLRRQERCRKGHAYAEHGYWNGKCHICRTCGAERTRQRRQITNVSVVV